jgi:hypothetical protein
VHKAKSNFDTFLYNKDLLGIQNYVQIFKKAFYDDHLKQ